MGRKSSINKIKRDNSKSKNIEAALVMYLYQKSHSPITTRFTGMGLQECDVISVSKSDYIYEYEIKISRQDFKKDFIKEKHNHILNEKFTYVRKGEQLYRVCNYFNYVVPKDLISITPFLSPLVSSSYLVSKKLLLSVTILTSESIVANGPNFPER